MEQLDTLPSTEEEAIQFLQEKGVFPKQRKCPSSLDHNMRLLLMDRRGFIWRCSKRHCNQRRISIRDGTFFQHSNIPLVKALRFIHSWCLELTSIRWCKEQLGMCKSTAVMWNRYLREVIAEDLGRRPCRMIGGEGCTVEVDETVIGDMNSNPGRAPPPHRIIGGICRETRQCFLKIVPDRNASTLLDAIKSNVAEGTTIYCGCSKQYRLSKSEVTEFQAGHRLTFVDATTEEHTNAIGVVLESLRWRNKYHMGYASQHLDSYLTEFIWRQEIGDTHPFEALLEAIKRSSSTSHCECERCGLTLYNQEDLNSHLRDVHGDPIEVVRQSENAIEIIPEFCPVCDMAFENVTDLLVHAVEFHEFSGTIKQEEFPSHSAFERWKKDMEEDYNSHWLRRSERTEDNVYYRQLRCHRRKSTKRKLDTSSKAVQKSCTSFMNVKRYLTSGVTSVEYCLEHFGHEQEPPKPQLPWSVKLEIAEMLKLGLPAPEIVRILQNENGGAVEQQHSVTVRDVRSVAAVLKAEPEVFGMKRSPSPELFPNTRQEFAPKPCPNTRPEFAESSMSEASVIRFKQEPDTMPTLASILEPSPPESAMPAMFIKQEPGTLPTSTFKTEPSSSESSVPKISIKEEPISAMSLLAQPSTRFEAVLVDAPRNDGVPVYTLAVTPDGRLVLVNKTPCVVGPMNAS